MAEYDQAKRELCFKLVYDGPALSGKTTNLIELCALIAADQRGEIMSLETSNDHTLFFDLLPVRFSAPSGLNICLKLFTVPGDSTLDSTRKAVLSRADGVVFVADSQRNRTTSNDQSFESLVNHAGKTGMALESMAKVVQFNKRDLPDVMSEKDMHTHWQASGWPLTFASAVDGTGVLETFTALVEQIYRQVDRRYSMSSKHGVSERSFVGAALGI